MRELCDDGLEHDMTECPHCYCEYCAMCEEYYEKKEKKTT